MTSKAKAPMVSAGAFGASQVRRPERGVTILIVAISLMAILAMSALAIDIVALYVTEGDAQRSADAAALAGAKAFVSSGFTSWQLGDPTSGGAQSLVCNGSTGYADLAAQGLANRNLIAGVAPTTVTTSCTFADSNPQITVTVQRSGLPSFFARIWGGGSATVTRTAKAEAYNPSGQSVPVQVHSVKPWLISNGVAGTYFDTTTYTIKPGFIGQTFIFTRIDPTSLQTPPPSTTTTPPNVQKFYALNIPIGPPTPSCPSTAAPYCSNLSSGGPHANYRENIGCSNTRYLVTSTDQIGPASPSPIPPMTLVTNIGGIDAVTIDGVDCLIRADAAGSGNSGQDTFNVGAPVTITGGYNNPNPIFRTGPTISRSDSVVTVPVYKDTGVAPCTPSPVVCNQPPQIIGFLQLGIQYVDTTFNPSQGIHAVILNAAGSNPANIGTSPVVGGGVSPIPVRLIQ